MNKRLMAFWQYDLFPYVVAGEIDGFDNQGNASWKGTGYSIQADTIIAIVPYEDGIMYKAKLDHWKKEYAERINKVKSDCGKAMMADIPFIKIRDKQFVKRVKKT